MSDPSQQPLIAHLIELRTRLIRALLGIILVFLGLFHWAGDIYRLLALPMMEVLPAGAQMIATDVTTPFFVPMKVTMMVAFLVSLPHSLYQAWAFVAPGLYEHERRFIGPLIVASTALFLMGMSFAYFFVFPVLFGFVATSAPQGVSVMTDIGSYLDFVTTMFVSFGVAFEVPIAVLLLVKFNLVKVSALKEARSYVIVGAFIIGAILTPPDVISQVMLAVPLWLLYEAGVLVAQFVEPKTAS